MRTRPASSGRTPALVIMLVVLAALSSFAGCSCFTREEPEARRAPAKKPEPKVITCPLCGMPVDDPAVLERRAVAVKVGNDRGSRPQSGLDSACVVYEEVTEGGVTRFMPLYLCRDSGQVGPVRSARPADIEIVFPYYALFAHCGGGAPTLDMIKNAGLLDIDEMAWTGAYWRTPDRRAPYNLYTGTDRIREAGSATYPFEQAVAGPFQFLTSAKVEKMVLERDREKERAARAAQKAQQEAQQAAEAPADGGDVAGTAPTGEQGEPDGSATPNGTAPDTAPGVAHADSFVVPYDQECVVSYVYDPVARDYLRYVAGAPHTDLVTGAQLRADTVVLQYVTEGASGIVDVRGAESPDLGVIGSGRAQVFLLGRLIDANWEKSSRAEHTRFTDNSGKAIPLKPGRVWVLLVPATRQATVS